MKTYWKLLLLSFLLMGAACSGDEPPKPLPTIVVDEGCQGMINHSFLSTASFELGQSEQGPVFGPRMVSFLNDGRVIWKYSMVAYTGEFTCENGRFEATFSEGEKRSFEGTYTPETNLIRIEDVNYLMAAEE